MVDWTIDVIIEQVEAPQTEAELIALLQFLLTELKEEKISPKVSELCLVLCDDAYIQALNSEHRGIDKATDVLSFQMADDATCMLTQSLGDIVISVDTTRRQAKELEMSIEDRLLQLLIHGLLHLFGYDHEDVSVEEKKAMEDLEDRLFYRVKDILVLRPKSFFT